VSSLSDLQWAIEEGLKQSRPVVIEVPIDAREYRVHNASTIVVARVTADATSR
jgi:thiamine pyrophosphate-dependent acetolactate synthase large subunit-like protein